MAFEARSENGCVENGIFRSEIAPVFGDAGGTLPSKIQNGDLFGDCFHSPWRPN